MHSRWVRAILFSLFVSLVFATFLLAPHFKSSVRASRLDFDAVARRYPNFTAEQRMAIFRQAHSQLHPKWRDLSISEVIRKLAALAIGPNSGLPTAADFVGNLTAIGVSANDIMVLSQQADCSLTLRDAPYSLLSGPLLSYTVATSTANYGSVLHSAAGLTTGTGQFPSGCGRTTVGTTSRKTVYVGTTTSNIRVYAGHFYNGVTQSEQIDTSTAAADDTFKAFNILTNANTAIDLTASDLNGDGNGDLVAINDPVATGGNATVTIFLGKADGTFPSPLEISLAGNTAISAVIDDFNGDGKKDIIVSTSTGPGGTNVTYYINFLAGNGDGTFQSVQSQMVVPPSGSGGAPYFGLISADLRGLGHSDLVTSAGIIFLSKGDGTFMQSATAAFPATTATSSDGPSVAAADFNKDGKVDLAVNNGVYVQIYLGKGDGTFTLNSAYSTLDNVGYLVAQDIDGDGNIDLYSGAGNDGNLGGDQFGYNLGYALMGNGDGTFRGAPAAPFAYTGTNLGDLNGDKILDAVGFNQDLSFTSYLGDGKGNFTTGATLATSPITISGKSYPLNNIDSYYVADINSDGYADLLYIAQNFYGPNYSPGIFIANGKVDGSFDPPTFLPTPAFVQAPDIDVNPTISEIHLADINHDGKLDLVYIYSTASYTTHMYSLGIAVQFGNGAGTFNNTPILTQLYTGATAPNFGAYELAFIADVNKDSNADMFVLSGLSQNSQSFNVQTYLGKGDGTFNAPTTVTGVTPPGLFYGTQSAPVTLADMNGDGMLDLVALQDDPKSQNLQIAIALGNGDGTFKTATTTTYSSQFVNGTGLAVADFNGDGKLDVATSSFLGALESGIAFGNGDGTLQTSGSPSTPIGPAQSFYVGGGGAMLALDLNGDGKPDILAGSVELFNGGTSSSGGTAISTTTTLTPSATTAVQGASLTFSAAVSPASGSGIPSGVITFADGSTPLSTATLDGAGKASYSTTTLSVGSHSITAAYGGSAAYGQSTSTAATIIITAPAPADFSIALAQSSGTINHGTAATITSVISITPLNGFQQQVALACSGAPQYTTCSVSPASVMPGGTAAVSTTLTVSTSVTAASLSAPSLPLRPDNKIAFAFLGGGALFAFTYRRIRRANKALTRLGFLLCFVVCCAIVGCSGGGSSKSTGNSTPSGSYPLTVTATAGATTHSTVFTLKIQ
jgi:hypothetical protein